MAVQPVRIRLQQTITAMQRTCHGHRHGVFISQIGKFITFPKQH